MREEGIEIPLVLGHGAPIVSGAFGTSIICLSARLCCFSGYLFPVFSLFICVCSIHIHLLSYVRLLPSLYAPTLLYPSARLPIYSIPLLYLSIYSVPLFILSFVYRLRPSVHLSIYSVPCSSVRLSAYAVPLFIYSSIYLFHPSTHPVHCLRHGSVVIQKPRVLA